VVEELAGVCLVLEGVVGFAKRVDIGTARERKVIHNGDDIGAMS
jgi:hypothetical protein